MHAFTHPLFGVMLASRCPLTGRAQRHAAACPEGHLRALLRSLALAAQRGEAVETAGQGIVWIAEARYQAAQSIRRKRQRRRDAIAACDEFIDRGCLIPWKTLVAAGFAR